MEASKGLCAGHLAGSCAKLWQRYALLRIIAAMQQPVGYATHLFLCANKC